MKILCCGMHRSGSTWQYNLIRLLLPNHTTIAPALTKAHPLLQALDNPNTIIKIHNYYHTLTTWADKIITSHRNPHHILASSLKFNTEYKQNITKHINRIRQDYNQHLQYQPHAHYNMPYTNITQNPLQTIQHIANLINIHPTPEQITNLHQQLQTLTHPTTEQTDYNPTTLIYKNHRTNATPNPQHIPIITQHFQDILTKYNYKYSKT
jgi:hypothetical protein